MFMMYTIRSFLSFFFFFNDTATTEIYTLPLHDALPISYRPHRMAITTIKSTYALDVTTVRALEGLARRWNVSDRKSTRLNSSHGYISYAVFCLKKKKKKKGRS